MAHSKLGASKSTAYTRFLSLVTRSNYSSKYKLLLITNKTYLLAEE